MWKGTNQNPTLKKINNNNYYGMQPRLYKVIIVCLLLITIFNHDDTDMNIIDIYLLAMYWVSNNICEV